MTLKQFDSTADNWMLRTKKLSAIAFDRKQPFERRKKAYKLFLLMYERMIVIASYYKKINQIHQQPFPEGGVVIK